MGSFVPATSANLVESRVNLPRRIRPTEENTHCFCAHLNILDEVDAGLGGEYRGERGGVLKYQARCCAGEAVINVGSWAGISDVERSRNNVRIRSRSLPLP